MRDLYHNVAASQPLNPVNSTATKTSSTIDLQGFNSLEVLFCVGLAGDTLSGSLYWTLKLQHSDDDVTYADLGSSDVFPIGTTSVVINSPSLDRTVVPFGYNGGKRYVKAVATPTGTHTNGTPIGVIALRGTASIRPVI